MKQIAPVFLFLGMLYAQDVAPSADVHEAAAAASNKSPEVDKNYDLPIQRVGPDDLLSVSVADCPELTRNFRVAGDGTLRLPLLKERLSVKDKLPGEIENQVAAALVNEQLLVRPVVSVSVVEYRSLPVSVLGAVRHPTTFQAAGEVTLLDALTRADGLVPEAGPEILVSRAGEPVQHIPVRGLIDLADPTLNVRLRGGEEVRVPEAGRIYVIGNVKKTGAFPMTDGSDTTVLKMVAMTEGLLPYTNKEAFIYRRNAGKTDRSEIEVQLTRIMEHKAPDVHLQPNDILYIPDSRGKRLTAETIRTVTGFGVQTATGILVWK